MRRPQDRYWPDEGLGGALRPETHYDGRRMRCFSERPATLAAMLEDFAARFPDRPAVSEGRTLTFAELDREARRLAAGLLANGIGAGDRVALFLGNRWEFLALMLACMHIRAIAVPIGTRQRRRRAEVPAG